VCALARCRRSSIRLARTFGIGPATSSVADWKPDRVRRPSRCCTDQGAVSARNHEKGAGWLWALCPTGGEMLVILTAVFALSVALVIASCLGVSKSAGQDDHPLTGAPA
jgi:hypothetical protein